jgi:hypothetical protein
MCRITFDENGEAQLHHTDLRARLESALDGPNAWMAWGVPRAVARNLMYKLDHPPQKPHMGGGLRRLFAEVELYWQSFPNLPEHATAQRYQDGNRIDDPEVSRHTALCHPNYSMQLPAVVEKLQIKPCEHWSAQHEVL